jgi:phytoene/squalene synthetase
MRSHSDNYLEIFNTIDFEKIKDHPNILIAASFWDYDRYEAAKTCYKFMRAIDDLIDNHKAAHKVIDENEKKQFITNVNDWVKSIVNTTSNYPQQKELIDTIEKFRIPSWPLEAFAKSMIYDIHHDGFPTLKAFLEYAEGASVAPASIFVHLCGIRALNGLYSDPVFDLKKAATPCAIFSYLVHIIRDFQKDQFNNLNYFADELIARHGLDRQKLRNIAHGGIIDKGFRDLIQEYYVVADDYRQRTYDAINDIRVCLEPRYQLSLQIIFSLYLMVFERIDVQNGKFTAEELNPTPQEVKKRVYQTIIKFIEIDLHRSDNIT